MTNGIKSLQRSMLTACLALTGACVDPTDPTSDLDPVGSAAMSLAGERFYDTGTPTDLASYSLFNVAPNWQALAAQFTLDEPRRFSGLEAYFGWAFGTVDVSLRHVDADGLPGDVIESHMYLLNSGTQWVELGDFDANLTAGTYWITLFPLAGFTGAMHGSAPNPLPNAFAHSAGGGRWIPRPLALGFRLYGSVLLTDPFDAMSDMIQSLFDGGVLNAGQAHSLLAKIARIQKSMANQNVNAALGQLTALGNEIAAFERAGILHDGQAAMLMELLDRMRSQMTG
jgi:hypothetical protein